MFDVLVYLYETYYRPDACPESDVLAKKLSAIGFEEDEIAKALGWLSDLVQSNDTFGTVQPQQTSFSFGLRVYAEREYDVMGTPAIGFIQFLESAKLINPVQREVIIESALASGESPIPLEKLKVIVLMVLWSQGKEPEGLIFDELFVDEDDATPRQLH